MLWKSVGTAKKIGAPSLGLHGFNPGDAGFSHPPPPFPQSGVAEALLWRAWIKGLRLFFQLIPLLIG